MLSAQQTRNGRLARLGRWSATHRRAVVVGWLIAFTGLGFLAPRSEHALSGGGWQADGSESVRVRDAIGREFGGQGSYALVAVVSSSSHDAHSAPFRATVARVERTLAADSATGPVQLAGGTRRTVVIRAGAAAGTAEMVRAAHRLRLRLADSRAPGVDVALTGSAALWSDFNDQNKAAMMRSEVISWPLTLAVLAVAFGSLAAAGIPLILAVLGLVATAGTLWLVAQFAGITIWAMNFALMFALAVGIDYALFVVVRFRAALRGGLAPVEAVAATMDDAGRAVLISGAAVIASLSAVMLVPSQPFRTSALGIVFAVGFVLAATLTLLPALLARLGGAVDRLRLPWSDAVAHRSERFARWGRLVAKRPRAIGLLALAALVALALPILGLRTAMPGASALPADTGARIGADKLVGAFGPGAASELQVIVPARGERAALAAIRREPDARVAAIERGAQPRADAHGATQSVADAHGATRPVAGAQRGDDVLIRIDPSGDPRALVDRLRGELPAAAKVGGADAEARDLERVLDSRIPEVYAFVLTIGFALLVLVVRAPVAAAVAVLLNLLATAAAFGVARLVFQEGHGAALLGFTKQGSVDAWAPIFFFALIFALAMDYSVFLLSSVGEEYRRSGDHRAALVEGLARSGRVINAAGAVMVVVFFTFALSGPLAPKEMGVILGVAVLLDTVLVRLALLPALLALLGKRAWWTPRMPQMRHP